MQDKINFLNKIFGRSKLQNNKIELMVPCPFCKASKKLKMNIRLDSDLWHCWVCSNKGRSLGRLIKQKNPSKVPEYYEKYSKNFTYNNDTLLNPDLDPVCIPEGFLLVMDNMSNPSARAIYRYATSRGLTDLDLWQNRIGFTDEWSLKRRMIIPSFEEDGTLNYWTARTIDEDNKYRYINAKANKRQVIFNEIDIDYSKPIYLVEGPFDLLKARHMNATCLLGSSLSEQSMLFYKLVAYCDEIVLCLDSDAQSKQDRIAETLMSYDKHVYHVEPPSHLDDWGACTKKEISNAFNNRSIYTKNSRLFRMINKL